jgi:uncharacterized protein (UPF0335 family)
MTILDDAETPAAANLHHNAKAHLRSFVERIERLQEERTALNGDIREVFNEAKGNGFDAPAIRRIIAMRKMDEHVRLEAEAIVATYMAALGMPGGEVAAVL